MPRASVEAPQTCNVPSLAEPSFPGWSGDALRHFCHWPVAVKRFGFAGGAVACVGYRKDLAGAVRRALGRWAVPGRRGAQRRAPRRPDTALPQRVRRAGGGIFGAGPELQDGWRPADAGGDVRSDERSTAPERSRRRRWGGDHQQHRQAMTRIVVLIAMFVGCGKGASEMPTSMAGNEWRAGAADGWQTAVSSRP